MSLVARTLEEAGVATVVIGSAKDVVEEVGVARFVFTDFPLGNPLGAPGDAVTQEAVLELALNLAETAPAPRTTVHAPFQWPDDAWRESYMRIRDQPPA